MSRSLLSWKPKIGDRLRDIYGTIARVTAVDGENLTINGSMTLPVAEMRQFLLMSQWTLVRDDEPIPQCAGCGYPNDYAITKPYWCWKCRNVPRSA